MLFEYYFPIKRDNKIQIYNENGLFSAAESAIRQSGDKSTVNYIGGGLGHAFYRSENGTELIIYSV